MTNRSQRLVLATLQPTDMHSTFGFCLDSNQPSEGGFRNGASLAAPRTPTHVPADRHPLIDLSLGEFPGRWKTLNQQDLAII